MRDAAETARKKIRLQVDQGQGSTGKMNSFSLGRKIIRLHADRLKAEIEAIEPDLESTSLLLQQAKQEKQELKRDEAKEAATLEKIKETCAVLLKSIEEMSPIFVDSLAESILKIEPSLLRKLLDVRDEGHQVEQAIWKLQHESEETTKTVLSLTERKKTLRCQLQKLSSEKDTALAFIDQIQELVPQKCVICLDKSASHAIVPCGHRAVCETCGDKLCAGQACPVCRRKIEDVRRIFFECPSSS